MEFIKEVLEKQKENCSELLAKLNSIGLEAICAGGFPRDYMLNENKLGMQKARDFDIYIKGTYTDDMIQDLYKINLVTDVVMAKNTGIDPRTGLEYDLVMNDIDGILKGIFTGTNRTFDSYELIFVDTNKSLDNYVFENFDVSICKATFDGTNFVGSKDFYETINSRKITFNTKLSPELKDYSFKKHINKLVSKFNTNFMFDFSNIEVPNFAVLDGYKLIKPTKIARKVHAGRIVMDSKNEILVRT